MTADPLVLCLSCSFSSISETNSIRATIKYAITDGFLIFNRTHSTESKIWSPSVTQIPLQVPSETITKTLVFRGCFRFSVKRVHKTPNISFLGCSRNLGLRKFRAWGQTFLRVRIYVLEMLRKNNNTTEHCCKLLQLTILKTKKKPFFNVTRTLSKIRRVFRVNALLIIK